MAKKLFYSIILCAFAIVANAPTKKDAAMTPASGGSRGATSEPYEIGIGAGIFTGNGDLIFNPSVGASVHARKSLDAIFSVRAEVFAGLLSSKVPGKLRPA